MVRPMLIERPAQARRPTLPRPLRLLALGLPEGVAAAFSPEGSEREVPPAGLARARDMDDALARMGSGEVDVLLWHFEDGTFGGVAGLDRLTAASPGLPILVFADDPEAAISAGVLEGGAEDVLSACELETSGLWRRLRQAQARQARQSALAERARALEAANEDLSRLALLDPLTEFLNRRGLVQVLQREVQWARRQGSDLSVLLVDLDDFKSINDGLGHAAGDALLGHLAAVLRTNLRATDYIARIGGDEFLVLLPKTPPGEALLVAEKLRQAIAAAELSLGADRAAVTASMGVAPVEGPDPTVEELLKLCHGVLRASKRGGKNRVTAGDGDGAVAPNPAEDPWIAAIHRRGALGVTQQPIRELAEGRIVAFEFFTRPVDGHLGPPGDLFRRAQESGLLPGLDLECLARAARTAAELPVPFGLHLNLFPQTLLERPIEAVLEALEPARPLGRICLELAEPHRLVPPRRLAGPVAALRRAGLKVAVDGVGFGHTRLETLVLLEPDVVKLDRHRVCGLAQDGAQRRWTERFIAVARGLGAEVIAAGVESAEDLAALRELGIGLAQGHYLDAPAS